MVPIAAVISFFTTALTFLEGVVEQVAPVVTKFLEHKANVKKATINPDCEMPRCGAPPYYCPEAQLSRACLQRNMAIENRAFTQHTTTSQKKNDNDDDNEDKEKSSSPSSTIMTVFILVIILAIIGFIIIRIRQSSNRNRNESNFDGRRSSVGSV